MERRVSERVQFFQLASASKITPIWVFQRTRANSTLGLIVDVSDAGAQILIDKSIPLPDASYELIVHADDESQAAYAPILVARRWSKAEGALYIKNGFVFDSREQAAPLISALHQRKLANQQWFRCELAVINSQ